MRARNLISYGMAAVVAAACSNPQNDAASDSTAELLSELEPALSLPAADPSSATLSAAELAPAPQGEKSAVVAPQDAPARVEETAKVDDVRPEMVHAVAPVHDVEIAVGAVAVAAADDHGDHDHQEEPSVGRGILIRGGVDTGIFGDPCIRDGHRPGQGAIAGATGVIDDASSLGPIGVLVNDQNPRIGRGDVPYPRSGPGSAPRAGGFGGMGGGGGRVFIR